MAKIKRFEDIEAWQEAKVLSKMVYDAVNSNKALANDYKFRKQIESASVSVMSNIEDGFSRRATDQFTQFLFAANESIAELQRQLHVALDQGYLKQEKFDELHSKSDEVAGLISSLIQYLSKPGT